jgi:prepilin-type N-terminal cleavage/methylation domain-containing protein
MMRRTFSRLKREDGFTLSEMLVVISILGLILGAFSLIFSSAIHHSGEIQEQNLLQTEVRAATDRIAREVRQSYYGDTTQTVIKMSTGTQLQFYSLDNQQPYHLRLIAYRLNGGTLERATATSPLTGGPPWGTFPALSAWGPLVDSIKNATIFTYFDGASPTPNATTTPANVRSVTITLSVATGTTPGRQFTYTTSAALRAT